MRVTTRTTGVLHRIGLIAVACAASAPSAASGEAPLPSGLETAFAELRSAAAATEHAEILARVHPEARHCGTPDEATRETRIVRQAERLLAHTLSVRSLRWKPIDAKTLAGMKQGLARSGRNHLPVDPEGALQVTWETESDRARAANLLLARADDTWYWVQPCPLAPVPAAR